MGFWWSHSNALAEMQGTGAGKWHYRIRKTQLECSMDSNGKCHFLHSGREKYGQPEKKCNSGYASSWVQPSIVEASLFQDVVSCFLLTLWFSSCSSFERTNCSLVFQEHPLSLVSWQMHFAILSHLWLTFKVYSSLLFHSHSSLAGSLPAHGTPSSVPLLSCAKSAKGHF